MCTVVAFRNLHSHAFTNMVSLMELLSSSFFMEKSTQDFKECKAIAHLTRSKPWRPSYQCRASILHILELLLSKMDEPVEKVQRVSHFSLVAVTAANFSYILVI